MINVSYSYKKACQNPIRKSYLVAKYGAYNKSAKSEISDVLSITQNEKTVDAVPSGDGTYLENIYVNTYLTIGQVNTLLKYIWYVYRETYYICTNETKTKGIFFDTYDANENSFFIKNIATDEYIFIGDTNTANQLGLKVGWQSGFNGIIEFNDYTYGEREENIGVENQNLVNLFSITPFEEPTSTAKPFSNLNKLYNETKETNYNYISCEEDRVVLDGNFYFINDKTTNNENEKLAYWSNELSNENGTFEQNPKIHILLSNEIDLIDLTLYFQDICESFIIRYFLNQSLVETKIINDNNKLVVGSTDSGSGVGSGTFNELEIEFIKTKIPNRYIKFIEIDFGVLETFTEQEIKDMSIIDELSIDMEELTANYLSLSLQDKEGKYDILNPFNKLSFLQEKQEITMYHYLNVSGTYKEIPLGTFLLKNFDYSNKTLKIEAYDDTYFMNDIYYGSKFYQNEEIKNILIDLFNYFDYTNYVIDDELDGVKLTGYIPNVEFREALRLICEAGCCVVNKNRYGKTYIFKTYDPARQVFEGKDIKNSKPKKVVFNNRVDVVTYNYTYGVENQDIVNSFYGVGEHILSFEKPILSETLVKGVENSNYTIENINAISCKINVISATQVYLKATQINFAKSIEKVIKNPLLKQNDYASKKIDNPLITKDNSVTVGLWKLNRNDIKLSFETLSKPYVEVGDTCRYITEYNSGINFVPTRLEFTKSIVQTIEGE